MKVIPHYFVMSLTFSRLFYELVATSRVGGGGGRGDPENRGPPKLKKPGKEAREERERHRPHGHCE